MGWLRDAVRRYWAGIFLRALALVLVYGALLHVGNIFGWGGTSWLDTPRHWRLLDVALLVFDLIVAGGLWLRRPWAVIAFVIGVVALQIVPYTLFPDAFSATPEQRKALGGLVITWLVLVGVLISLLLARK